MTCQAKGTAYANAEQGAGSDPCNFSSSLMTSLGGALGLLWTLQYEQSNFTLSRLSISCALTHISRNSSRKLGSYRQEAPRNKAYWSYYTMGRSYYPGGLGQKDQAISLQASIMLENEMFLSVQMLSPKSRGKKPSLLILPNLGQSSLFYVVKHSSLRMWDVRQLKHFFLFGSGLSPFWGDPEKIGSSEGRTLLWNIHYNLQL